MRLFGALAVGCGRIAFDPRGDAGGAVVCPANYTSDSGSCYRTGTGAAADWFEAEALCEADGMGAHLAAIDDAAEAVVVDRYRPSLADRVWIGATDLLTERGYLTVTNRAAGYTLFGVGEQVGIDEDCIRLKDNLELGDGSCATDDDDICEYDGIPAVPAAWGQ